MQGLGKSNALTVLFIKRTKGAHAYECASMLDVFLLLALLHQSTLHNKHGLHAKKPTKASY